MTGRGGRVFHPNWDGFTMIAGNDTADYFVDDELLPGLRVGTSSHKKLEEPKPIGIAGNKKIFTMTTCIS